MVPGARVCPLATDASPKRPNPALSLVAYWSRRLRSRGPPDCSFLLLTASSLERLDVYLVMSSPLYTACAEVLSAFQANKDDLDALLNPESGFAPRLRDICYRQCVYPPSVQDAR